MAKKEMNKSQAIRNYLARKPNAGPKEIVAAMKKKGIEVNEGLAANVKYARKAKSGKKIGSRNSQTAGNYDALIEVKKLADQFGADTVRQALNVLDKL